jgi:phosphoribosylaminoimidazole-succinocarboxamide synthase
MNLDIDKVEHIYSGKIRELYALDELYLAIVTSDRISAYDTVLENEIPGKGIILNQLSIFWTEMLSEITPTHLIHLTSENINELLSKIGDLNWLNNRTMIVRKAEMLPLECIVRGYIAGSAWREYTTTGQLKGFNLPSGLQLGDKLPQPIFTPSTKSKEGHDLNITLEEARTLIGDSIDEVARISLELYLKASTYAEKKGVIIADTKFEFGIVDGQITLADEVLTPDSSRFWYVQDWNSERNPRHLDKQVVRDWLANSGWNYIPPAPNLPDPLIESVRLRYAEIYNALTKNNFSS